MFVVADGWSVFVGSDRVQPAASLKGGDLVLNLGLLLLFGLHCVLGMPFWARPLGVWASL